MPSRDFGLGLFFLSFACSAVSAKRALYKIIKSTVGTRKPLQYLFAVQ